MTLRLALIATCVAVVAAGAPGTARAQNESVPQERSHQTMIDNANASAQASTDMSYGGTADTRGASGQRAGKTCWPRAECDVFFGH